MLARKIEYFVTSGVGLMTDHTTLSHELRRAVVGSFLNSVNHFTCCWRGPRRFWHLVQRSPDDRVIDKDYHVANIAQKNLWLSGHVDHPDMVENPGGQRSNKRQSSHMQNCQRASQVQKSNYSRHATSLVRKPMSRKPSKSSSHN